MPSAVIKTALALVVPFIVGKGLTKAALGSKGANADLSLGLSFGLGLGAVSLWMMLMAFAGVRFRFLTIGVPMIVVAGEFGWFLFRRRGNKPQRMLRVNFVEGVFLCFAGGCLLYVFWTAMNVPLHVWDEIERTAFKAKVFSIDGSIAELKHLPHASYPLLVEFAATWIALMTEAWNDQLIKITVPLLFVSYLFVQHAFLRNFTDTRWALGGACLLMTAPFVLHHATILYADLPLMYFNCGTVMLLILWDHKKDDAYLLTAAVFSGLGCFTKLEGSAYFIIHTIVLAALLSRCRGKSPAHKAKILIKFMLPGLSVCAMFLAYKFINGVPIAERVGTDFSFDNLSRIPVVFEAFMRNLFLSGNWGLVWVVFFLSLANVRKFFKDTPVKLLLLFLVLFFGAHFLQFIITPNYYWISDDIAYGVLARLVLHFYPLAVLLIILFNYPLQPEHRQ